MSTTSKSRMATAKKGSVTVTATVGDIEIAVESVALEEAEAMAGQLLKIATALRKKHPQLRSYVETVPGGTPTEVVDDDWQDDSRRVGFTM